MVWREPIDHLNDYYFSMINIQGIEKKNRQNIFYSSIPSVIRPVLHSDEFPPPVNNDLLISYLLKMKLNLKMCEWNTNIKKTDAESADFSTESKKNNFLAV